MSEHAASEPAAVVVRALADGRPRARAALARECGLGHSVLERVLSGLPRLGVELIVGTGTVALPRPVDLLDPGRILAAVPRLGPGATHVRFVVESTNSVLAERLRAGAAAPELCIAEIQTEGRGRHGRRWVSGLGQSLVLSVSWRFAARPEGLSALSLAVGVALAEALACEGFGRVMLKWPNDLVVDDRKLAGILVEASHSGSGAATCVVGVGFNLDLAPAESVRIDQPWTDSPRSSAGFPIGICWPPEPPTHCSMPASSIGTAVWSSSQTGGASATCCGTGPCVWCRGSDDRRDGARDRRRRRAAGRARGGCRPLRIRRGHGAGGEEAGPVSGGSAGFDPACLASTMSVPGFAQGHFTLAGLQAAEAVGRISAA